MLAGYSHLPDPAVWEGHVIRMRVEEDHAALTRDPVNLFLPNLDRGLTQEKE